jgi:hypothetical protein
VQLVLHQQLLDLLEQLALLVQLERLEIQDLQVPLVLKE